jgi:hypothetical protein
MPDPAVTERLLQFERITIRYDEVEAGLRVRLEVADINADVYRNP